MGCGCSGDSESGFLNWKTSVKYVFFKWWNANTRLSFATTNILLFIFAFLFEGLSNYRSRLDHQVICMQTLSADPKRTLYSIQGLLIGVDLLEILSPYLNT